MPYRDLPPWVRKTLRVLLALIYTLAAWAGASALLWPAPSVETVLDSPLTRVWPALIVAGALVGLWAQVRDDYRFELIGVGPIAAGIAIYAIASARLALDTPVRHPMTAALGMLAAFVVFRAVELVGHRHKLARLAHPVS